MIDRTPDVETSQTCLLDGGGYLDAFVVLQGGDFFLVLSNPGGLGAPRKAHILAGKTVVY